MNSFNLSVPYKCDRPNQKTVFRFPWQRLNSKTWMRKYLLSCIIHKMGRDIRYTNSGGPSLIFLLFTQLPSQATYPVWKYSIIIRIIILLCCDLCSYYFSHASHELTLRSRFTWFFHFSSSLFPPFPLVIFSLRNPVTCTYISLQ